MKVLLVNGSPHKEGCTYTALCEVADTLNHENIETEIFLDWEQAARRLYCLFEVPGKRGLCI